MKTLTKIFMAVVALFAVSCVTDLTDDLGVNLGEGQTTISISLEESRTHLGTEVDGEYPLYWSEGDKIAVNGVASNALPASAHGQQSATFKIGGLLNYPRTIVYPAPAEGVKVATTGQYPVTFLATQAYKAGSFAEGAAPMYAYQASSDDAVTLNHLSGVLRIAPYGDATIKALVVAAETGALAGNFDVAADGTLTAHADATSSVTVTFGEGLTLGATEADAKPIYVAVPAGEYGLVSVTLITDNDSMVMRFNTSGVNEQGESKAIKAGKVREFAAFEYAANNETTGEFLIYDEATLRNFAANIANIGEGKTYAGVKVVADIDMTGKSWTAVDNFSGVFDGGNHKIKGLTAPLFGATANAVTIKNIHLTDVDITISGSLYVGAIALHINNAASIVENCSAEGKLLISGTLPSTSSSTFFGGCFGYIENATKIYGITNKVNVNVAYSTNHTSNVYVGGCLGLVAYIGIEECHNYGNIKAIDTPCGFIHIGGVVSSIRSAVNPYKNLSNAGNITIIKSTNKTMGNTSAGGICAQHYGCILQGKHTNTGNITIEGDNYTKAAFISGVIGIPSNNERTLTITDAEFSNSGTLTWNGTVSNPEAYHIHMGGVFAGSYAKFTGTAKSIANTGDLICRGSIGKNSHIGGIITGRNANASISGLENAKCYCKIEAIDKGENCWIGMLSSMPYSTTIAFKNSSVGGSVQTTADDEGKLTLDNYMQYLYRKGSTINESVIASIDKIGWLAEDINSTPQYKEVAGIEIDSAEELLQFAADVTANPELVDVVAITADIDMTGVEWTPIVGFAGSFNGQNHSIKGLNNSLFGTTQASKITNVILENVDIEQSHEVGLSFGALARLVENDEAQISNCKASGKIDLTLPAASGSYFYVGGLIGRSTTTTTLTGLVNEIDVSITVNLAGQVIAAGCLGTSDTASLDNCQNLGNIYVEHETNGTTTTGIAYGCLIGGLGGQCCNVTNCTNGSATDKTKGKVHYATYHYGTGGERNYYVGGVTAVCKAGSTVASNCKNYGEIKVSNTSVNNSSSHMRVAGIIGEACHITESISDCENYGPINVDMDLKSAKSYFTVAGIANDGNYTGTTFGQFSTVSNCYNYGKITLDGASVRPNLQLGGIFNVMGGTNRTYTNVKNYGNIELKNTKLEKTLNLGGVAGIYKSGTLNGVSNEGDITISETTITDVENSYVGGVFGSIEAPVSNVRCFCTITAIGYDDLKKGFITGTPASSGFAITNSHVGGNIATTLNATQDGPAWSDPDDWTFIDFIYGEPISPEQAIAGKLGWLERNVDDTPIGADGAPIVEQ